MAICLRQWRCQQSYNLYRSQKAFEYAKERLLKYRKGNKAARIYSVFVELFADKWHQSIATISQECVRKRLEAIGIKKDVLAEWDIFFTSIAERAFGTVEVGKDQELFSQADTWIKKLEVLL